MTKLAAILAVPIALLATVFSLGVMVVDVREGGPDGHHFVVPVPLVVAQAALAVVPAQRLPLDDREALEHLPLAREVLRALAEGPDGELVRVEEGDEQVLVVKERGMLRVRVHKRDKEDVSVNIPLHVALSALPDGQGRISTLRLASALGGLRFTDLVDVRDGDERVRVWVW